MSKVLANLLDQPLTVVESAIAKLENLSGFESVDVRLLAQISAQVRDKTTQLGLDPDDTTPEELYHALRNRLTNDEMRLADRLNLARHGSEDAYVERFMAFVQKAKVHPEVWALKDNAAKKLLREHPPKKLLKHLNYRSVESILKREYIGEIVAALPQIESERWLNVFWRDLANLSLNDFEDKPIRVVVMSSERWDKTAKQRQAFETLPHIGVIAMWPADISKSSVIGAALEFFEAVAQLKAECSFLKLGQFEADFGEQLLQAVHHNLPPLARFTSLSINWHSVCRHFSDLARDAHANFLPQHVQHEDMHFKKALEALAELDPSLRWWRGTEHLGAYKNGRVVSLNLADLIKDHQANAAYDRRSTDYLQRGVWHELINKYLDYDGVKTLVLGGLDGNPMQPEPIPVDEFSLEGLFADKQTVEV